MKNIATVRSVGASTRIEGSKMSNEEIKVLLDNLEITKIENRDSQEVVGYFDVLELISENFQNVEIINSLHSYSFGKVSRHFIMPDIQ